MNINDLLLELNPCGDGYEWAKDKSVEEIVKTCPRGDWLLWLAKKLNMDIRLLTLAKGRCAETVIHLMKDERSRKAVEVAISFGNGDATREQLDAASKAAAIATSDAVAFASALASAAAVAYDTTYEVYTSASAASTAAYAVTFAASAAYAAVSSIYADSSAFEAAAAFASGSGATDREKARKENLLLTANICRNILGDELIRLTRLKGTQNA